MRPTLCIKSQNSLNCHIYTAEVVSLEHDLAHLLPVSERVHWWFGQKDLAASRIDFHLLEESVIPKMLHVVPVPHNTILHRVAHLQHGAGSCCLVTAHDVLDNRVISFFFGPQNRSADDGRILEFWEVLREEK